MKKRVIALALMAVPVFAAVDAFFPVSINGKHFANAVTIAGDLFISVEDFSKAIGGGGTVHVQGNKLAIISPRLEASNTADTFTKVGAGGATTNAAVAGGGGMGHNAIGSATGGAGAGKVAFNAFTITRSNDNASPVLMSNGKPFIAVKDVARLFGGNLNVNVGTLRPGQTINLTVASTPGASIAAH